MSQPNGKTVWMVCVPDVPHKKKPTPQQIAQFCARHPELANTEEELVGDRQFAQHVLGTQALLNDVKPFRRWADKNGLDFKVRFISWDRAFWKIKDWYQAYVVARDDVMIYQVPSSWSAHFASEKMLTDITNWLNPAEFPEQTLNWYRFKDKIYAVPMEIDLRLVFFNKRWLQETDFHSREAFLSACERVMEISDRMSQAERLDAVMGIPTLNGFDSFHILPILMWNMGLTEIMTEKSLLLFTPEGDSSRLAPEAAEAIDLLVKMRERHFVSAPHASMHDITVDFTEHGSHGKYAMVIAGPWMWDSWQRHQGNVEQLGVALPPDLGAGSRYTFQGGSGLGYKAGVRADKKAIGLAKRFLQFRSKAGYQRKHGLLPANKAALETKELFTNIQNALFPVPPEDSSWISECSRIYPRSPQWAAYIEQWTTVDILDAFWRSLQSLTETTKSEDVLPMLQYHLVSMNRGMEQTQKLMRVEMVTNAVDHISHQIKSQIQRASTNIVNASEVVEIPDSAKTFCNIAQECIDYAKRILDEYKKLKLFLNEFECSDVRSGDTLISELWAGAQRTITSLQSAAQLENHHANDENTLPVVRVNLKRLELDIEEFVINSHHHKRSDLKIAVWGERAAETEIQQLFLNGWKLDRRRQYMKIIYTDNGPGIEEDRKRDIFLLHYTMRSEGSGIGLAIAQHHAEGHEGAIRECGQHGRGVRFEIFLPALQEDVG